MQNLRPQGLAARKGEQLADKSRGAIGILLDLHNVLEGRIGRPVIGEQQIGIADDRGQHIVEVMRDAARELADRLHLLRLREIFLQGAQFRRIERIDRRARPVRFIRRRNEETRGAIAVASETHIDGRDIGLRIGRGDDGGFKRGPVAVANAGIDAARRRLAALERIGDQFGKGRIRAPECGPTYRRWRSRWASN